MAELMIWGVNMDQEEAELLSRLVSSKNWLLRNLESSGGGDGAVGAGQGSDNKKPQDLWTT